MNFPASSSDIFHRVRSVMQAPGAISFAMSLISRGMSVFGGIALTLLLARTTGSAGLGLFTYVQSWIFILAIIARFGTDVALIRRIAVLNATGKGHVAFHFTALSIVASTMTATGFVAILANVNLTAAIGREAADVARVQMIALPALVAANVCSGYLKGQRRVAVAGLVEFGAILGVTALIGWFALVSGLIAAMSVSVASGAFVGACYCVAVTLILAIAWQTRSTYGSEALWSAFRSKSRQREGFLSFYANSWPFMMIVLSAFVTQSGSFAVAGSFLTQDEMGQLRAAERLAVTISFALLAINPFMMPRLAIAYARDGFVAILPNFRRALVASFIFSAPVALTCIVFGRELLGLFGSEFQSAYPFLLIMIAAQFGQALLGVSNPVLAMTRYEKLSMVYSVLALVLGLILFALFSQAFGPVGFCIAYLTTILFKELACATSVLWLSRASVMREENR